MWEYDRVRAGMVCFSSRRTDDILSALTVLCYQRRTCSFVGNVWDICLLSGLPSTSCLVLHILAFIGGILSSFDDFIAGRPFC